MRLMGILDEHSDRLMGKVTKAAYIVYLLRLEQSRVPRDHVISRH
jgi:hypothetical protein